MNPIWTNFYKLATLSVILLFLNGCAAYFHQPTKIQRARIGEETVQTPELRNLPRPSEKLVAAVYKFRDQTGQYKPSDNGISYSTAVTQGATNILLKALDESGWFVTIERENVSNLLNERKIIRSSMAQFKSDNDNLPPLLFAGIILEGGIVSYDANIITGGAGLKYFGAGGSTQYRQDRVTVYLRAVATKTGKILKTVYTSKTILSQTVNASLFQFVKFKRLLEAETGFTTNEPSQMAVTEAIEKSVEALVLEGVRDGLWTADAKNTISLKKRIDEYELEQAESRGTDVYGATNETNRLRISLLPTASILRYSGDYGPSKATYGYGANLNIGLSRALNLQLAFGSASLGAISEFKRKMSSAEVNLQYRTLTRQKISPFVQIGYGTLAGRDSFFEFKGSSYQMVNGGVGLEYALNKRLGINITGQYNYILDDGFDSRKAGSYNDSFLKGTFGLMFYLGGNYKK